MNEYLARLKAKIQEKPIPQELPKLSKPPFGSFGSDQGRHVCRNDALLRQAACAVRPAGYSDAEWLAAVADADRLGYPPREAAQ